MINRFQSVKQFRTLLNETSNLSDSALDRDETMSRVIHRIRSIVQCQIGLFFSIDSSTVQCTNSTIPEFRFRSQLASSGMISWAVKNKQTLSFSSESALASDYRVTQSDRRLLQQIISSSELNTPVHSILLVPLLNKSRSSVGAILLINKESAMANKSEVELSSSPSSSAQQQPGFSQQDQSIVEFLAVFCGTTLDNATLYEEAVVRRTQTETLLQISELMAAEIDSDKVIQRVIEASSLVVNADRITLWMVDDKSDMLVAKQSRLSHNTSASSSNDHRVPIGRGIIGYVATTGKVVNARDTAADWRFDRDADQRDLATVKSSLVVPVTDHSGRTVAVIEASPFV